jgi:hypothetical protein
MAACSGDLTRAIALYEWNCAISGALYETLGDVEVVLRNALHEQLAAWHAGKPGHWYDDPGGLLTAEALDNIAHARKRIKTSGKKETPGQILAELNFGFWRYLLVKRYKPTLWRDAMRHAFPNLAPADTDKLFARVARLHTLRNRIAHHEQIHTRLLKADLTDSIVTVGLICKDTAKWVHNRERVSGLLAARPK